MDICEAATSLEYIAAINYHNPQKNRTFGDAARVNTSDFSLIPVFNNGGSHGFDRTNLFRSIADRNGCVWLPVTSSGLSRGQLAPGVMGRGGNREQSRLHSLSGKIKEPDVRRTKVEYLFPVLGFFGS